MLHAIIFFTLTEHPKVVREIWRVFKKPAWNFVFPMYWVGL